MANNLNYFELFDLEPGYELDMAVLAERYRRLQQACHPDRHAGGTARDVRLAVQKTSLVNQAYEVLKSPVARALYLLELAGVEVGAETYVTRDGLFLVQQMEMREALEAIREDDSNNAFSHLSDLSDDAQDTFEELQQVFGSQYRNNDFVLALDTVAKMQFFVKFLREIEETEEEMDAGFD